MWCIQLGHRYNTELVLAGVLGIVSFVDLPGNSNDSSPQQCSLQPPGKYVSEN
jgi:hypothetical protein